MAEDLGVSDAQIEVLSGVISIYSLVGALLAGWISDRLGRRLTIVLANAFFLAGPLAMAVAGGYAVLMARRFVAGVGVGYALVIAPVYTAEIAPASSRGLLTYLAEVMFAAGAVPTVFLAAGVLTMPESPRWLAMKGRLAEARPCSTRRRTRPPRPSSASSRSRTSSKTAALAAPAAARRRSWRRRPASGACSPSSSRFSSSSRSPASTRWFSTAHACSPWPASPPTPSSWASTSSSASPRPSPSSPPWRSPTAPAAALSSSRARAA
uniref:Major facilitator superfamily (MFS) profile domain-containing protein n=1 Tax=Arundo donax TaxID=35708 RepID=A0A0A9DFQ7_ARUDO